MSNAASAFIDRHIESSLGHKRAFDYGDKPYTYNDLAALANRAGNMLKALGVMPGARVAILLPESPAYLATLIGAMKIGAVPVVASDAAGFAGAAKSAQLAVVHSRLLADARSALPKEKTVVVGEAPDGHPSFVELLKAQPSSLAAQPVASDAPALSINGEAAISHAALAAAQAKIGRLGELLSTLANAQTARLS